VKLVIAKENLVLTDIA